MTSRLLRRSPPTLHLEKAPTGIQGLDEITQGGLPRARPTLVCGTAGCGKTLMAMEFLVRGASQFGEPGVFMAFEETEPELVTNVASLGFDVDSLVARKKLFLDHVRVARSEIEETGEYDLEGLFIRLGHAIDSVGAKRVVLDTLESLFAGFTNPSLLRSELRRLFRWLKDRKVTAIITAERGEGSLTRQGLEEYVSDCVILLDHRVIDQVTTRRMRIVKYRGSSHGTNEYPFLIDRSGISVLPITSVGLNHPASSERISSGIPALDQMLGGKGYYRGSTVLVSGTAGTGKSTVSAHFADAACRRGERCLYFAFEESPGQIVRNMRTIGLDLAGWLDGGLLKIISSRPTLQGLEMHLLRMHQEIQQQRPRAVVVDPVTNLINGGNLIDTKSMLVRMIDFLKTQGITALLTSLTTGGTSTEATDVGISSLVDTWIILRDLELGGERNRAIQVLKARGVSHSNQIREFLVTREGIRLVEPYLGATGVLTGSARLAQEAADREREAAARLDAQRGQLALLGRQKTLAAQMAALKAEADLVAQELSKSSSGEKDRQDREARDRTAMAISRRQEIGSPRPARRARSRNGGTPDGR